MTSSDSETIDDLFHRAREAHKRRDFDTAESLYRDVLERKRDHLVAHGNLGNLLANKGLYEEAQSHYQRILDRVPDDAQTHANIASVFEEQDDYEKAESHYRKAVDIQPENPHHRAKLGRVLERRGQNESAIEQYREAVNLEPSFEDVHFQLGYLLSEQGQHGAAEDHYREVLDINPGNHRARSNLGLVLKKQGRYDEAESHYREVLENHPDDIKTRSNLAVVLREQERYEEAEFQYRKALEFEPENVDLHTNLGIVLQECEQYVEAETHYRSAVESNPEGVVENNNYAIILAILGRHEEAKLHFERAIANDTKNEIAEDDYEGFVADIDAAEPPVTGKSGPPSSDSIPEPPAVSVEYGALREETVINNGGNAEVTKATLSTPTRDVPLAIKKPRISETNSTLDIESVVEPFLAEAETWDKLDDHDHIVTVVDYGATRMPWIALEFMDGGHLGDWIGGMELSQACWTAVQVTDAVYHAHRRGVVHLDLKPENILFRAVEGAWDVPKVADWGLSKHLLDHDNTAEGLSVQYAAPEQLDDQFGVTDDSTDIYQLGAVFYTLFTGQPPIERQSIPIGTEQLSKEPAPPSDRADVPDELDEILLRALAPEKGARYDDIVYLRDDLQDVSDRIGN